MHEQENSQPYYPVLLRGTQTKFVILLSLAQGLRSVEYPGRIELTTL